MLFSVIATVAISVASIQYYLIYKSFRHVKYGDVLTRKLNKDTQTRLRTMNIWFGIFLIAVIVVIMT
ncbi:hypothetical protein SAMN04488134_10433 [Amphibacillus marinus]|uniref:Uncharacterized protein n=1 Tax=Amphibacillus marinus TaxID=872970 RepID=A0A1H8M5G5_9BACI|nr:hypothetical protein SAMN04488134_10433 [Amphibacillus marinus]